MSGLTDLDARFVRVQLEAVQDAETDGLLEARDVAKAALDADLAAATLADPNGSLYILLGSGARTVTEVTLLREPGGWAVSDVRRAPVNGPRGFIPTMKAVA